MTMSSELLLPEVLTRIFSFLHIEDRKNVRLVCKEWNNCCNHPAVLKREKFVFRSGYSLENIVLFLQNCKQIRKTVEFQGSVLDELSDDLWQIIGRNIYSLTLNECTGTPEVTKNIFIHCSDMHSFKSSNRYQARCRRLDDTPYSLAMWDELIELHIERQKVTYFQLFVGGVKLAQDVLQKIFKIFPCISHFGTGYPSYDEHVVAYSSVYRSSLHNTFNPALIKELIFNVPCSVAWLQELSNIPSLKLQKLDTVIKESTVSLDIFSKLLQNQCGLETLKISLLTPNVDYKKPMLFKILSICTKLIDFSFRCCTHLDIEDLYGVLKAVSESQLQYFMIKLRPTGLDFKIKKPMTLSENLSTYLNRLIKNKRLRTLKLDTGPPIFLLTQELKSLLILQLFCNLRHLEMTSVSITILQTIFKYHIHLQTLIIHYTGTAFGFTDDESDSSVAQETSYSISRLQELEHLELGFLVKCSLEKAIQHFNFPRLKYCRLGLPSYKETEITNLQSLPAMIPLVEVLIIDHILLSADQCSLFCEHLQRLKFFVFKCIKAPLAGINEEMIKSLFIARPSLKYVGDLNGKTYFYDRFLKVLNFVSLDNSILKKLFLDNYISSECSDNIVLL